MPSHAPDVLQLSAGERFIEDEMNLAQPTTRVIPSYPAVMGDKGVC